MFNCVTKKFFRKPFPVLLFSKRTWAPEIQTISLWFCLRAVKQFSELGIHRKTSQPKLHAPSAGMTLVCVVMQPVNSSLKVNTVKDTIYFPMRSLYPQNAKAKNRMIRLETTHWMPIHTYVIMYHYLTIASGLIDKYSHRNKKHFNCHQLRYI